MSEELTPGLDRAIMLVEMRRYADAEQMLRALLASEPGNVEAVLLLAAVLDDQDRFAEAEQLASTAVQMDPDSSYAHRVRADTLRGLKRYDEAVAAAHEAVRLDPLDWRNHVHLGLALRVGRRPRFRDALDCANQAVRLEPHASSAHNLAGMCLDDLGLTEQAMTAYLEALRLDPGNPSVLNNIAVLQADSGKLADASAFLTAGLSADAQEKILHQNYDFILYKLMRRLFWTEVGFGVLIGILAGNDAPWIFRVLAGAAMLGAFVWITRGVLAGLPRGAERHALGLFRRTRGWMRYGVGLFAVITVAVLLMAVLPNEASAAVGIGTLVMMRFLGIVVIIALVVSWIVNLVRRR